MPSTVSALTFGSVVLSPAIRRALGEGVESLRKGDLGDCAKADQVIADMAAQGYLYGRYDFFPGEFAVVNAFCGPYGAERERLTDQQRADVLDICPEFDEHTPRPTLRMMVKAIARRLGTSVKGLTEMILGQEG